MTTNNKRTRNKRKGRASNGMALEGMGRGVPGMVVSPHLRITLPYAQSNALTEAAATLGAAQTFRINSVFDPDFTGGGLQPLGLDQYAQFYGRYRVLNVRFELSMANGSTTLPVMVGMYAAPQSTLPAVATAWRVQPVKSTQYHMLSPNSGGQAVHVFNERISIADALGVTNSEFKTDQDFSALLTADPARPVYLHIWVQGLSGTAASVYWSIRMWQDVEFSQPVSLSLS